MVDEIEVRIGDGRVLHAYDTGGGGTAVMWHHGTPNVGAPPRPLFAAAERLGVRFVSYDRPRYGFGNLDAGFALRLIGPAPSAEAEALSAQFRTAWTRFATTGDPGWPAYDPEQRLTHVFDLPPADVPYPEDASRRLWQNYRFGEMPLTAEQAAGRLK